MSSTKETVLEINLAHLAHNFKYLKSKVAPHVKMLAVVKASGYGSDAAVIAKHLEKSGADYFAVAYVSEGIALREKENNQVEKRDCPLNLARRSNNFTKIS